MKSETKFEDLGLNKNSLKVINAKGFEKASEIQSKIIPLVLANNQDIIGVSKTGSGKTASFGIPILEMIEENNKRPKVIILAPTRELALQVTQELESFKGERNFKTLTVYGGSSINNQIKDLKKGVDIVVGTPGRVLDLINRDVLDLSDVDHFVLDEADEMLKMGFIEDIETIFDSTPRDKRVLLFSATMPDKVKKLSNKYMKNQTIVEAKHDPKDKLDIRQSYFIPGRGEKFDTLKRIIDIEESFYGIVFCMKKSEVNELTQNLKDTGYKVDCIHGDIPQNKREIILNGFKKGNINILVATDVAARGIDVDNLSHVVNYSLPNEMESYVHRIGRTGRAGKSGEAISFLTNRQKHLPKEMEKATKSNIEKGKIPTDKDIREKNKEKNKQELKELVELGIGGENLSFAEELIEEFGARETISALLSKKNESLDSSSNESEEEKIRLFISKGKDNGFDKRSIFQLLERESGIDIDGDDFKMKEKFSFVTVPQEQGRKILESFSKSKGRPLVEEASRN